MASAVIMELNTEVKSSEGLGEFFVSKTDIDEGQVVLVTRALYTTSEQYKSVNNDCCLSCLKILKRTFFLETAFLCPKCKWPVCSLECANDNVHQAECRVFSENHIAYSKSRNCYLKLVRILLTKGSPEFETFMELPSDFEGRQTPFPGDMNVEVPEAFDFLRNKCRMDVTIDEIWEVLSRFKRNCFILQSDDLSGNSYAGYAVFKVPNKFNHSCAPNLEWSDERRFGNKRWEMRLHTRTKIKKGDMLCMRYSKIGAHLDTTRRRKLISRIFPFDCLCSRCQDPTEEGTYFGSTVCETCTEGSMLATDPLNGDSFMWKCDRCPHCLPAEDIFAKVSILEAEIDYLTELDPSPRTMELVDRFIERNTGKTLHKNHFVLLKAHIYWMFFGNFTKTLLKNEKTSKMLFEKILHRADRIHYITTKLLHTKTLVDLELFLAQKTLEFGFKTLDLNAVKTVMSDRDDPQKLYYAQKVLLHLTKAVQREELNPENSDFTKNGQKLRALQTIWIANVKQLSGENPSYEDDVEEAFISIENPRTRVLKCTVPLITSLFILTCIFLLVLI